MAEEPVTAPAPLGVYVHIPFCARKCAYCDFPSWPGKMGLRADYARRVAEELRRTGAAHGRPAVDTVYVGGGTPTLLTPGQMRSILRALHDAFAVAPDAECSCEANPGMVSDAMLAELIAGGINRLSLGAQSAQPDELATLGRQHTWPQVEDAVRRARRAGFRNLNIDLMLGLPGQTPRTVRDTLDAALALRPEHVSCYGLIVEDDTPLAAAVSSGALQLPEEDAERAMYALALDMLAAAGYARYEVSNFALPRQECLHNLHCWQRVPYLGAGAAAHSLMPGRAERRANPDTLEGYLRGDPPAVSRLSPEEQRFESVMLGLRMVAGVRLQAFQAMHGVRMEDVYAAPMRRAIDNGIAEWTPDAFRLTARGMDVMNTVLVDFLGAAQ